MMTGKIVHNKHVDEQGWSPDYMLEAKLLPQPMRSKKFYAVL